MKCRLRQVGCELRSVGFMLTGRGSLSGHSWEAHPRLPVRKCRRCHRVVFWR